MVYRKRTGFRKRRNFRRRPRLSTKMMLKPKRFGRISQPIHYFTRFQDGGSITALASTTTTYGVVYFELASVPGYAEYTAMYDFYKINAVQVRFIPTYNVSVTGTATVTENSAFNNRLITVIDYNDRAVPTSVSDLRQYGNCKVGPNNRVHKRFLHPRPTIAIDEDSGSGSVYNVGQTPNVWISTAANQCEWYGIKYGIQHNPLTSDIVVYKLEFKLYLSFKGRN